MNRPWFKAFAADYLLDPKIDALPPEAEGLVWRIWCICHLEGSCTADPEELARKIRRPISYVLKYKSYYESLFELKGASYVSPRMERERKRSETNSANVSSRYKQKTSTTRSANGNTTGRDFVVRPSDYDNDSGVELDLDLIVHEIAKFHPRISDPAHLPQDTAYAIAEAVNRHGADAVLAGTKSMAEVVSKWPISERNYVPSAPKYYRNSDYLKDPREWERSNSNGNGRKQQTHPTVERVIENRGILADVARARVAARDGLDGNECEGSPRTPPIKRISSGVV